MAYGPENVLKGGLLDEDLNSKPAFHTLNHLINTEWKTRTETTTNSNGALNFRGFPGSYHLTLNQDSSEKQPHQLRLTRGENSAKLII